MDRLIIGLVALIFAGGSYHFWEKSDKLEQEKSNAISELKQEREKSKIKIGSTTLSDVTKFTFLEVTNEFSYIFDKSLGKLAKADKILALYEWDYTFSFGFDLKSQWNWCPKVIDQKMGIVQVNAPDITQTNSNKPAPSRTKVFNGAYWDDHKIEVEKLVHKYANKKTLEIAENYISKPSTKESVKRALSKHLQTIMNSAYPESNPISEVKIIFSLECSSK